MARALFRIDRLLQICLTRRSMGGKMALQSMTFVTFAAVWALPNESAAC